MEAHNNRRLQAAEHWLLHADQALDLHAGAMQLWGDTARPQCRWISLPVLRSCWSGLKKSRHSRYAHPRCFRKRELAKAWRPAHPGRRGAVGDRAWSWSIPARPPDGADPNFPLGKTLPRSFEGLLHICNLHAGDRDIGTERTHQTLNRSLTGATWPRSLEHRS